MQIAIFFYLAIPVLILFNRMKLILLLPLSLGLVSPAIAHNIQNTVCPPGQIPVCLTPSSCACMPEFGETEK